MASIWHENMLGCLFADCIFYEEQTVFRKQSSRKTVSYKEQIISNDKYPSKFFKSNGGHCVYDPSVVFRNSRDLLKIEEYHSDIPQFWGISSHVTRLDQWYESGNI